MKTVNLNKETNQYEIKFRAYGKHEFVTLLTAIKTIPGRMFQSQFKMWTCPVSDEAKKILETYDFIFTNVKLNIKVDTSWKKIKIDKEKLPGLLEFQYDGMRFLKHNNGCALIGDDMGVGKTVQALSWLKYNNIKTALIVVPSSIKLQWAGEFTKWGTPGASVEILYGRTPHELENKIYIINWDILYSWCANIIQVKTRQNDGEGNSIYEEKIKWNGPLLQIKWGALIGDEIQAIGNHSSQRTKAFKKVAKNTKHFVPLSGTPIKTKVLQFYPILNLLDNETFGSRAAYQQRYCDPKHNGFGWTYNGASNIDELHKLISKVMIRRELEEVATDLKGRRRIVVPLDDIKLSEYTRLEKQLLKEFSIKNKNEKRKCFKQLKNSAFEVKKKSVNKWIEEFISTGNKLIVFAWHRSVVEYLHETFKNQSVIIYGGMTPTKKEKAKKEFIKSERVRLLFGNILSAGVGIDGLQEVCHCTAMVEFPFCSADVDQCEGRVYRSGQNNCTLHYYLIAPGTCEEQIAVTLDNRGNTMKGLLDGKKMEEDDLFMALLKKYGEI